MKNSNYWINRSNERMYEYLSDSEKVSAEIAKAYRRSERYIKSETDKIFQNFVGYTGISEADARLLLKTSIGQTAVDKLKSAISSVSDENIRKQMLAEINTPAYQARIKRLEELNSNIINECNKLYGTELKLSTGLYTDIADKAFNRTIYDIQKGTGIGYSFSQLPKSRIDEILRNNWSGKHYSQRIWGNTQKLADNLKEDLLSGILSGKSGRKIAEDIAKRYNVSIHNAERLVRTETNYIANQAEIESYKESGIEKYRFVATLDSRTSEICQQLDGQEFSVSDAQAGVNLPPMHAHCRSTTISVISEKCLENLERRAKNPDGTTTTVPADMSYKEWKDTVELNDSSLDFEDVNSVEKPSKSSNKIANKLLGRNYLNTVDEFKNSLESIENNTLKTVLQNAIKDVKFKKSKKTISYFLRVNEENFIYLRNNAPLSTVAHELFHKVDRDNKITKNRLLDQSIINDYNNLIKSAEDTGLSISDMLYLKYPEAFERKGRLKEEYRGISDIINGMTKGKINLGYYHKDDYWEKTYKLPKETFAQYGRFLYDNNLDVMKMINEIFPETTVSVNNILKAIELFGA